METLTGVEVDGQFHTEMRYSYENGRLALEVVTYNPDHPKLTQGDSFRRHEHTYEDNTITVRCYDDKDNLVEIQIFAYGDNDYNTRQTFIYVNDPDDSYTHDDHGNMIVDHCVMVSNSERTESVTCHTYELIELFPSEMEEEE